MLKKNFTAREATRLTGFRTTMMVDYLCRMGIVVPSARARPGRGRRRLYSFGDLVVLRAIERLLQSGVSVAKLKGATQKLQRSFKNLTPDSALQRYVVTDGKRLYLANEPDRLIDLNQDGQLAFTFVIDAVKAREEVVEKVRTAG